MAKSTQIIPQNYPRIEDEDSEYHGCLDDSTLVGHQYKIQPTELKNIIRLAIDDANKKSSRAILCISADATSEELARIYEREGKKLFSYFQKYCGDPAATAH